MKFQVSYYMLRIFSNGLDEVREYDSESAAFADARKTIKETKGHAHAIINEGARLVATITYDRGRLHTRRAYRG